MKRAFLILVFTNLLAACVYPTGAQTGENTYLITYDPEFSDALSENASPSYYTEDVMGKKAAEFCPTGYEIEKERRIINPPDGSKILWDIKCLPRQSK